MNRSIAGGGGMVAWALVLAAGVLFIAPLWLCWCHPPEMANEAIVMQGQSRLILKGREWIAVPGLPFGSDLGFASQSAHGFTRSLEEGNTYPRWVASSNRGFGGPTFFFYPPLPYYAVALASRFTSDIIGGMRLVLSVAGILAGLSFFVAVRRLTSPPGAALAAILYVLLPYHAIDLYDRFAFASYLAFAWFPLLFMCVRSLARRCSRGAWFGLVAAYAGLVLTHLVSGFLCLFILVPYAVIQVTRKRHWGRLLPMAGAGMAALLCCSIYLVPMLSKRNDVNMQFVIEAPYGDFHRNFVYRDEVAHGFSQAGIKPWVNLATSAQGLLALVAGGLLLLRFQRYTPARQDEATGDSQENDAADIRFEGLTFLGLAAWTFFLQIPVSTPVWAAVPDLATVQFPWRFGTFNSVATCFLVACAMALPGKRLDTEEKDAPDARPAVATRAARLTRLFRSPWPAVLLSLAALPALLLSARLTFNRAYVFDEAVALGPAYIGRVMFEYIPQGVEGYKDFRRRIPVDMERAVLLRPGNIEITEWDNESRRFQVQTATDNEFHLRTFHFPGWRAWVDGNEVAIVADGPLRVIEIPLTAGTHDVHVAFTTTTDRKVGAVVSSAAVATMLLVAVAWTVRARRAKS